MSDVALANAPEARTETGEIRDQQTPPPKVETTEVPKQETTIQSTEPKTEQKPDDASSLLNKDKKEEPKGAPEKYEAWKAPEGFEITEESTKEVNALFKELNLSQSQGQKLVDAWAKSNLEAAEAPTKAWEDLQAKWVNDVKMDSEMGHKLPEIKATIGKALDSLGDAKLTTEFRNAMDMTGAGNNPAFIKAFWKLAQAVTESGYVAGKGPSPLGQKGPNAAPQTAAKAMYPNLP